MQRLIKAQLVIAGSLVAAICLTLAACGGGGSTAGAGGGGGTTVAGSVVKGGSAAVLPDQYLQPGSNRQALAALQLFVPAAQAAVYQVTLICTGGFNDTQSTNDFGKFTFVGGDTLVGSCQLLVNGTLAATFDVTSGSKNEVEINDNGGSFSVAKMETENEGGSNNVVKVEVEDGKSSDQASNDDKSSEDGKSSDQTSENEKESEDDKSSSNSGPG